MTIFSLEVGQVLSGDVHVANGRRLFSSGHVITEQTLRVLKIWGVQNVPLHGEAKKNAAASSGETRAVVACSTSPSVQLLYRGSSMTSFPVSCLFQESKKLAEECVEPCEGFFSYLYTPSIPELKVFTSEDCVLNIDKAGLGSYYSSFPKEFFVFTRMLNDVYVTTEAVVEAVESDEKVKNKLLLICESLVHVSNCRVKTVNACTAFLGNRTVLYLAIMLVYIHHVQENFNSNVIMHYGRAAMTTGIAARYIASAVGVYGRECFFSSGALRDIGYLFYSRTQSAIYEKVRQKVINDGHDLCAVEEKYMGKNHADVGAYILKILGFPTSMEKTVEEHHTEFNTSATKESAVMHVAECIAKALTFNPVYDVPPPTVDVAAWRMLHISEANLTELVRMIYLKSKEITRLAYGE
ncbi:HDOD domain-containing protein [Halodesulfovibrio sp.]|uniref:HDOD domain-containing protein n=1 Tax=Halodesulfovibrio sp. TaxID=1912772 RepID=UPI0025C49071|nr:HDOD domain-containing protein [Halodesulfovibrio sp.]